MRMPGAIGCSKWRLQTLWTWWRSSCQCNVLHHLSHCRDYLIFPFHPFFFYALFLLKSFLTCVLPLFSSCCRYLIMAGWAGSTTAWVPYDGYINGPTQDTLSVRCSLSLPLSSSVSLCLAPCSVFSLEPFAFPFPFTFTSSFLSNAPTFLEQPPLVYCFS